MPAPEANDPGSPDDGVDAADGTTRVVLVESSWDAAAPGLPHVRRARERLPTLRRKINDREHRETRRRPAEALAEERARLHPLPGQPFTIAFGTTRRVNWDGTISVDGVRYSVPC